MSLLGGLRHSTHHVLIEHAPAQRVHGPPAGQAQQRLLRSEAPFATWVVTEAQAEEVEDMHSAVREAAGQQRALVREPVSSKTGCGQHTRDARL